MRGRLPVGRDATLGWHADCGTDDGQFTDLYHDTTETGMGNHDARSRDWRH